MDEAGIQIPSDGAGPMYHRIYAIELLVPFEAAKKTMHQVMNDPNKFSPQLIATFEKTKGASGSLQVGDEFFIHVTGPWKAPVRVSQVNETCFALLTLEGHIEAGRIEFRLVKGEGGLASFEIESVTRSKDQVVNFFYDKLRLAQFAQTEMWELFCRAVAETSLKENGLPAKDLPKVRMKTERQDRKTGQWVDVSDQLGANGVL